MTLLVIRNNAFRFRFRPKPELRNRKMLLPTRNGRVF